MGRDTRNINCGSFSFVEIQIDDGLVGQLMDMGFAREGCRKAVYHTKNSGIEAAVAWVMEHAADPGTE